MASRKPVLPESFVVFAFFVSWLLCLSLCCFVSGTSGSICSPPNSSSFCLRFLPRLAELITVSGSAISIGSQSSASGRIACAFDLDLLGFVCPGSFEGSIFWISAAAFVLGVSLNVTSKSSSSECIASCIVSSPTGMASARAPSSGRMAFSTAC